MLASETSILTDSISRAGRNEFVDIIKGQLILLVCLGHAIQFVMYNNIGHFDDQVFKAIYMFHMPLFMCISGYLSNNSIVNKNNLRTLAVKMRTYLLPTVTWSLLLLGYSYLSGRHTAQNIGLAQLFFNDLLSKYWFLWTLAESYCLFFLAYKFFSRPIPILILAYLFMLFMPDVSHLYYLKYMFPYFSFGFYVHKYRVDMLNQQLIFALFVFSVLGSVVCYFEWGYDTYIYTSQMRLSADNIYNIALRYAAGFIVSAAFALLSYMGTMSIWKQMSYLFSAFGKNSMQVYILQTIVFSAVYKLYGGASLGNWYIQRIAAASLVGCAVAVACLLAGKATEKVSVLNLLLYGRS